MAPVDIPGGIQLPPAPVLEAILKQQKNGAEVGPAEPSSNQIDVDIKNPAFEAQRKTKQRVSDIFIYGEKKAVIAETKQQIAETKEMEVKRKYKRLHEIINEELQIKNIDIILSQPKGKLLEVHLYGLYNG